MLKKESVILFWYIILLVAGALLGSSFSSYNYVYALSAFIVLVITGTWKLQYIKYITILITLFTIILFFFKFHNLEYYILDSTNILIFFILLSTVSDRISKKTITNSYYLFLLYLCVYFITYTLGFNIHAASNNRYLGLMGGVNLSSSIVLFMMCFICEYLRVNKKLSIFIWGLLLSSYIYMVFITSTRSLLFALPYWLYSFTYLVEKKNVAKGIIISVFISSILAFLLTNTNQDSLESTLRLSNEEYSFQSREFMQFFILEKILSNYFILPSGFHASLESLSIHLGEKHPAHNDILSYWNEWGAVFLLFALFFWKSLKRINLRIILVLIIYVGACLHNLMFSVPLLFPFFMTLNIGFYSIQNYNELYLQETLKGDIIES